MCLSRNHCLMALREIFLSNPTVSLEDNFVENDKFCAS